MRINEAGLAIIRETEQGPDGGPALVAYLCPAGVWTIGWGDTGPDVVKGLTITRAEADRRLARRLSGFEAAVLKACLLTPTLNEFSAMVSLAYNIGVGAFLKSSVLRFHNAGESAKAAESFMLWNKATGADGVKRELKGLTRRRNMEAALYLTPTEEEEEADPQRTRAADVVPSPVGPAEGTGTGKVVAIGGAISAGATGISQVVSQAEPVWTGLQQAAGPMTPHVVLALIGLVAVVAICTTVWLVFRNRRSAVS